ncbi:serine threonine protein kinase protein [Stemphylium lycopersici]|nr:serine threonine protein kinase protein [Stemphylium lycopersici]
MRFQLDLDSSSSELGPGTRREQNKHRNKLRKAPPAPNIVSDPNIRARFSRQAVNLPPVLSKSFEKFKARFALQRKTQSAKDMGTLHEVPSLDECIDIKTHLPKSPSVASSNGEAYGEASSAGSSKKSHTTSNTSDSSDDVGLCRADWKPLKELPHLNFLSILSQHVGGSIETADADYRFVNESQGGYNYVRIYELLTGPSAGRYVIKAPSVGTAARRQEKDAYMLRSEFGTIKLIRERTDCPVPDVIAYSDSLENDLGAPFILMKACSGRLAVEVWHDADDTNRWNAEDIDIPSAALYSKRTRILRSLAHAMAELQKLVFDKIGVLDFDNINTDGSPNVGPGWLWSVPLDFTEEDLLTDKPHFELPVHDSSSSFFVNRLLKEWPYNALDGGRVMVIHHLMDTFFRSEPFAKSVKPGDIKETFVLHHDDLNLQNIFCDPETGELTGIIDWERASTAPHCLGYASLPIFLTLDWYPEYSVYNDEVHNPFALTQYRKIYAEAMIEATGEEDDGKYTHKSAMYQAAHAALYGSNLGRSIPDFVRKMLYEIPELNRVDMNVYLTWLGEYWWTAGDAVKKAVSKVAAPLIVAID